MLPPVRIEPRTSYSKSNTLLSELTWRVLLGGVFKFLFMHHLIFGIIIQVSSERRVLGLESEALGSILTGGNIFLLIFFLFSRSKASGANIGITGWERLIWTLNWKLL